MGASMAHVTTRKVFAKTDAGRLFAFGVLDRDMSLGALANIIKECAGVTHMRARRLFSGRQFVMENDVLRRFSYMGQEFMIWQSPFDATERLVIPVPEADDPLCQDPSRDVIDLLPIAQAVERVDVRSARRRLVRLFSLDF